MRSPRRLAAAIAAFGLLSGTLVAQEPVQVALVPVFTFDPIPGANGSSWVTDLWVSNSGSTSATVDGLFWDCFIPQCGALGVEPGVTLKTEPRGVDNLQGRLLYLDTATAGNVDFSLRFRDLSRQATTAGTELSVPRENAFHAEKFSLVDVPVVEGFRQTLRIYELDGTPREASVRVRTFRIDPAHTQPNVDPDVLLGEMVLPLQFQPVLEPRPERPGYAQVSGLSTLAPLGDAEHLRLEIEPVTPGLELWAFVTVIHNETQHATVITPQ